ncbi:hybrid sensor histidine kinase/response regulator transcription factor [Cyclobacterium marinum]|uniref:hybrid sensor histidine kinase/response regulator transcription factor n=1 Tax=Cyclobacterium marinum TaxID=104 RepID=UPI0030DC7D40
MNTIRQHWLNLYKAISLIGFDPDKPREKQKQIKLLNIFCGFWILIEMASIIAEIFEPNKPPVYIFTHLANFAGISLVLYLQRINRNKMAIALFFFLVYFSNFMFSNFIISGKMLEAGYLLAPAFVLLFTNNRFYIFSSFVVSLVLFIIPNIYFLHYPQNYFGPDRFIFMVFAIVFVLVYYFKQENLKSELALEIERKNIADINEQQSQFFINVSHEVRTPLTLIKGQINKLKKYNSELNDAQIQSVVTQLNNQADKIKKLVDDVIDLAKMQDTNFSMSLHPINLTDLLKKIATSFEPLFKQKQITFKVNTSTSPKFVLGDKLYLERALNNILLNALKYTEKKGKVTLFLKENQTSIIIGVEDDGIGIEKNDLELIFNRFYQSNNSFNKSGGSGVGLAFSKEIITKIGGTIRVSSKPSVGSTFVIHLPKVEKIKERDRVKNSEISKLELLERFSSTNKKVKILLVDDAYDMRLYLKDLLCKYECLEAGDGHEALKIIKSQAVDFIITDYMMPNMNGLEFISKLKSLQHSAPILMLTARADNQIKLSTLRLGIDDYLLKPFEEEELIIRINNALINNNKRTRYQLEEKIDPSQNDSNNWIDKLQAYIFEQSGKSKINQTDLAEHFNLSSSSLFRKIKSETGLSPNELITEVKLQKAKMLLENRQVHSLKQLVLEVGFKHSSYFSKKYYERFGSKPNFKF